MKQSTKLSLDLVSTIIVTLIAGAVTVAAVISMAWFASNKEVGTNGSSVTVDTELFEIKVAANTATNRITDKLISDGYVVSPLVTSPSNDGIIGDIIIDSSDNYGNAEITIRPGAYGCIEFSILPKKNNLVFSISPLLAGNPLNPAKNTLITSFAENIDDDNNVNYGRALQLAYGHFLVFTQKDGNSYNNRVMLDGNTPIYINGADRAGKEYKATLYWIWARTYADLQSLVGQNIITASENRDYYFEGNNPGSSSYNNGDQIIGDAFADLVILGTVQSVESIPETEGTVSVNASLVTP